MAKSAQTAVKGSGRPAKSPELGKRVNVMFRLNEVRRDTLMHYAEQNGRSLSEEVEMRVADSISADLRLDTLAKFVGGYNRIMFSSMVNASLDQLINEYESKNEGKQWHKDPAAIQEICEKMQKAVVNSITAYAWMAENGLANRFADIYKNDQ